MIGKKLWLLVLLVTGMSACSDDELLPDEDSLPGTECDAPFQWTRAEDVETRSQFLRNFGVGYSYNAVRGSYCDWKDIRCQVVNRYFLEQLQRRSGEVFLHTTTTEYTSTSQKYEYSKRDYVANVHMETKEEIDLGLYESEMRKRQNFIEDGVQETFYYTLEEKNMMARRYLSYKSMLELYRNQPDILTLSFRNAISHLSETQEDDMAAIDSFVNVWGTHVIIDAELGGKISVDLMNYMWRYQDQGKDEEWTTEEFLTAVKENSSHSTSDKYTWIEDCRLNINAKGGDQSTLTNLLGEHAPDGTRTFSIDGISEWRRSLYYDPDDEHTSNVELVGMTVVPIWEFAEILDKWVALRIKAAVLQDVTLQQQLLGDWNFFDASFPVRYPTAQCKWRQGTNSWQTYTRSDEKDNPMVVNIESGGRFVATVCHETIQGIDLWVCYPIYEGRINLACGYGVDENQQTYSVKWINGQVTLKKRSEVGGPTFYITSGAIRCYPLDEVQYAESHPMPYIELAGGVTITGGYQSADAYNVRKVNTDFELTAPTGLTDIVGFTESRTKGLYRRNENYVYIYNPNEVKY